MPKTMTENNSNNKENTALAGKITSGVGGLYTVITDDGRELKCSARGSLRFKSISPYPGDNVLVTEDASAKNTVDEILERKNFFKRPPAANIDKLFITIACADPSPSYITSDKLTCAAEYYGTVPVIIITKRDLDPEKAKELETVYTKSGYSVFVTSSADGNGVRELKEFVDSEIKGCTAVFAGESGVGKSSLMNALFPNLKLTTGAVSRKIARGKHTTRAVTLYPLDEYPTASGSFLADTPGFGIFDLTSIEDIYRDDVCGLFREFERYVGKCRYRKCTHLREEGCAILEAVENSEIAKERHESYVKIYEEIKSLRPWQSHK